MRSKIIKSCLSESCIEVLNGISQLRSSTGLQDDLELESSELLRVGEHLGNILGPVIEGSGVTQVGDLERRGK